MALVVMDARAVARQRSRIQGRSARVCCRPYHACAEIADMDDVSFSQAA